MQKVNGLNTEDTVACACVCVFFFVAVVLKQPKGLNGTNSHIEEDQQDSAVLFKGISANTSNALPPSSSSKSSKEGGQHI